MVDIESASFAVDEAWLDGIEMQRLRLRAGVEATSIRDVEQPGLVLFAFDLKHEQSSMRVFSDARPPSGVKQIGRSC